MQVSTEREFGLLCMELVARLEDTHAALLPGTARPPEPAIPHWTPGFACLVDDQGGLAVFYVAPDSPAQKAGVKPGMVLISIDGTSAADLLAARMKLLESTSGTPVTACSSATRPA